MYTIIHLEYSTINFHIAQVLFLHFQLDFIVEKQYNFGKMLQFFSELMESNIPTFHRILRNKKMLPTIDKKNPRHTPWIFIFFHKITNLNK